MTDQKGSATIALLLGLVVILGGALGYIVLMQQAATSDAVVLPQDDTDIVKIAPVQKNTQGTKTNDVTSQPTQQPAQPTAVESPRLITCNPRTYDAEYFKEEKPCVSDMRGVDVERENIAVAIIEKASAGNVWKYGVYPHLLYSHEHYVLVSTSLAPLSGYVVVDLVSGEVTDFFRVGGAATEVERSPKRLVFLESTREDEQQIRESVRWYAYGTSKSKIVANSEISWPQSYIRVEGGMGFNIVTVIASDDSSITLGIHDRNKSSQNVDAIVYEQVGTRVVRF